MNSRNIGTLPSAMQQTASPQITDQIHHSAFSINHVTSKLPHALTQSTAPPKSKWCRLYDRNWLHFSDRSQIVPFSSRHCHIQPGVLQKSPSNRDSNQNSGFRIDSEVIRLLGCSVMSGTEDWADAANERISLRQQSGGSEDEQLVGPRDKQKKIAYALIGTKCLYSENEPR